MSNSHEKVFKFAGFNSDSLSSELIDCLWHDASQTKQGLITNIGFLIPVNDDKLLELILNHFNPIFALTGKELNFIQSLKNKIVNMPIAKKSFYEDEVFFVIASIPTHLLNQKDS